MKSIVERITRLPVKLSGGTLTLANGRQVYVEPWRAWWLAKLWTGRVLAGHHHWNEVSLTDLRRDYLEWASQHCQYACNKVPLKNAILFVGGFEPHELYGRTLDLRSLARARRVWDNAIGPMEWPKPLSFAGENYPPPRRPFDFSQLLPQGELLAA
jgi:hypothetical protein